MQVLELHLVLNLHAEYSADLVCHHGFFSGPLGFLRLELNHTQLFGDDAVLAAANDSDNQDEQNGADNDACRFEFAASAHLVING